MAAPKYPEGTEKSIGTLDKEDKDGKKTEHMQGEKLVTGAARITRMANKTKAICEEREKHPASPSAHPPAAAAQRAPLVAIRFQIFFDTELSLFSFIYWCRTSSLMYRSAKYEPMVFLSLASRPNAKKCQRTVVEAVRKYSQK